MQKSKTVNLYEAKTQLSKLVEEAAAGAEIVIAKSGTPKARLGPLEKPKRDRTPGGWKGQVWVADDFDDELPADVLAGFPAENDAQE